MRVLLVINCMRCNKNFLFRNAHTQHVSFDVFSIHNDRVRVSIDMTNEPRKDAMKWRVNRRPNASPQYKWLFPETRRQIRSRKSKSAVDSRHDGIVPPAPKLGYKTRSNSRPQQGNAAEVCVAELSRASAMIFLPVPLTSVRIEKKIHIA